MNVTSEELNLLKELREKARPFDGSIPAVDMTDEDMERVTYNGQFFVKAWEMFPKLIEGYETAVDLLRLVTEMDPAYASEIDGDAICFFCGAWLGVEDHESNCGWEIARSMKNQNQTT